MKKLLVAAVGACASLVSFGFDWTGKTGVVTLTETAEVADDDIETVVALDGIRLEGEATDIVFKNTQPVTFVDCEDLENLENWTALVAGKTKPRYTITVSGGEVTLKPFGMAILVR